MVWTQRILRIKMNNPTELLGRLELAHITDVYPKYASGTLLGSSKTVYVSYFGKLPANKNWLVVIDGYRGKMHSRFTSNFVTSQNPDKIVSLAPNEYFLFGSWDRDMHKLGLIPTLEELGQYFNPGSLTKFLFLWGAELYSRSVVTPTHQFPTESKSLDGYLDELNDLIEKCKPRLIVTDARQQLDQIVEAIRKRDCIPIQIERCQ